MILSNCPICKKEIESDDLEDKMFSHIYDIHYLGGEYHEPQENAADIIKAFTRLLSKQQDIHSVIICTECGQRLILKKDCVVICPECETKYGPIQDTVPVSKIEALIKHYETTKELHFKEQTIFDLKNLLKEKEKPE